jgi:hypothetical protein
MVMLLVICFLGAVVAVLGPTLAAKYQWVSDMLSFGSAPTIAQREALSSVEPNDGVGIYVLMFLLGTVVFGGFIAPIMFPRAHRVRSEIIQKFSRKSGLTALADVSLSNEYSLEELRHMALSSKQKLDLGMNTSSADETIGGDRVGRRGPADHRAAVQAVENDPLKKVRTLDGFGSDGSDEEPTRDWGSVQAEMRDQLHPSNQAPDSDVIPFEDVPSVPTDLSHVHAGLASDDETVVRRVSTGPVPAVTAAAAATHANADETDEDKTMLQIERPDFGPGTPDGPTTSHRSLRSRLAARRSQDD